MELKAAACGRVLPVVALTTDAAPPLGADAAVNPDADPATWAEPIRTLLPYCADAFQHAVTVAICPFLGRNHG